MPSSRPPVGIRALLGLSLLLSVVGCASRVPAPGSEAYLEATGAFYGGVAAMQIGDDLRARARLDRVVELVPSEAAAWGNLAILALRRGELDFASTAADRAWSEQPESADVRRIVALASLAAGDTTGALNRLMEGRVLSELDMASLGLVARIAPGDDAGSALEAAHTRAPGNQAVWTQLARWLAARGDREAVAAWTRGLRDEQRPHPDAEVLDRALQDLESMLRDESAGLEQLVSRVNRVANILPRADWYRSDLAHLGAPSELVSDPLPRPLALPSAPSTSAPADLAMRMVPDSLGSEAGWTWIGTVFEAGGEMPVVALAREESMSLPSGTTFGLESAPRDLAHVKAFDLDQDYLEDMVVAGAQGVAIHFQGPDGAFSASYQVTSQPAQGVWVMDYDSEGDLDLLVSGSGVQLFTNLGDGSFQAPIDLPLPPLADVSWGDLDDDGDPDLAAVTSTGRALVVFNRRNGLWDAPMELPGTYRSVELGDLDRDGVFDLALVSRDGSLTTASYRNQWAIAPVQLPGALAREHLFLEDMDSNGSLDWIVTSTAGTEVLLSESDGRLAVLAPLPGFQTYGVSVLREAGTPALVGLSASGHAISFFAESTEGYHWKRLRPQAAQVDGDRRINTFAVGGEIELRSGMLYQKRPITGKPVHLGLGDNLLTEVARIVWPNGDVQAEFDLLSDEAVLAQQRLKGSCPWVFTDSGRGPRFVTDFLWRSPLGLRINAQETAGIATTTDWIRIPHDALSEIDGAYRVHITAELWESHFLDHVALMVVDHPADAQVMVDERFAFPPPELALHTLTAGRPFQTVRGQEGETLDELALHRDGRHIPVPSLGPYQGIAAHHSIELVLPDDAPADAVLVGFGWVRPTDSSINVAIGQGLTAPPTSLQLEVPDGNGGWNVLRSDLGFPSGKNKTVLIDLSGVKQSGDSRTFRLGTNLEIYWDQLAWAVPTAGAQRVTTLTAAKAELRFRGFSAVSVADSSSPEIPDYANLVASHPVWRDLEGYHTRFGDVRELLNSIDDRYVIMNAGDEMVVSFDAPPPPPAGWIRDFVLVGDGWVKDGDLNTTFSTTVLPLPTHASGTYDRRPTSLEEDPVYLAHPSDWETYHTRYVAPDRFSRALSGW